MGNFLKKIRNFIGLKLMSFLAKHNYRIISLFSERSFEYPWIIMRIRHREGRFADFGSRNSMLIPYFSSLGYEVYGIDLNADLPAIAKFLKHYQNFRFIKADMRKLPFVDNFFDVSVSVSTLEHIFNQDMLCEDKIALREITRVTKKGGQILITMPYGKGEISKFYLGYPYKIYNQKSLAELLRHPALKIEELAYFLRQPPIWIKVERHRIEDVDSSQQPNGTVCVSLTKI